MINIVVIGVGQLGSRHLQALAMLKIPAMIQVVDLVPESLKTAAARFDEVGAGFKGTISYHTAISEINKQIDVAIIATNSKGRRSVAETLTATAEVKHIILEKFLFPHSDDYAAISALFATKKITAWVNCPRRMMGFYQQLQANLSGPIHFSAIGSAWGLGCNGIHFLDLFAYLTKSADITLSDQLIDKKIIESKRSGYIEFTGTITGYSSVHSFHITSYSTGNSPVQLVIYTPTARYTIHEGATSKVWKSTAENNWIAEELTFDMPFQSKLTNLVVEQILERGTCELTPFDESAKLHLIFLNNLLSFLRTETTTNSVNECLIT